MNESTEVTQIPATDPAVVAEIEALKALGFVIAER